MWFPFFQPSYVLKHVWVARVILEAILLQVFEVQSNLTRPEQELLPIDKLFDDRILNSTNHRRMSRETST
jgi:hypothetical protein